MSTEIRNEAEKGEIQMKKLKIAVAILVSVIIIAVVGYIIINYLKDNKLGRATFFPIDTIKPRYIDSDNVAVISGPSFAVDIASLCPIGLSLATSNEETDSLIKKTLQNDYLKLRSTHDIVGVELCGSIKNVIAIAAGILDGMGFPESTQAMFITESLHDIKSLINALGGDGNTILSFAGFGDLLLTCTSVKSRNYSFGKMIGNCTDKKEIDEYKTKLLVSEEKNEFRRTLTV